MALGDAMDMCHAHMESEEKQLLRMLKSEKVRFEDRDCGENLPALFPSISASSD